MKAILFFFIVCIAYTSHAQKLKKIIVKNKLLQVTEVFYVLKNDKDIKHGDYEKTVDGQLLCKGKYDYGEKTGIWNYYNYNKKISHRVDYTNYRVIESLDEQEGPYILGGLMQFLQLVGRIIRYPEAAKRNGTQGKVYVKFIIGTDGKMKNFTIERGIGDGCDEEAIKSLRSTGQDCFPYIDERGEKKEKEIIIPINFNLGG